MIRIAYSCAASFHIKQKHSNSVEDIVENIGIAPDMLFAQFCASKSKMLSKVDWMILKSNVIDLGATVVSSEPLVCRFEAIKSIASKSSMGHPTIERSGASFQYFAANRDLRDLDKTPG